MLYLTKLFKKCPRKRVPAKGQIHLFPRRAVNSLTSSPNVLLSWRSSFLSQVHINEPGKLRRKSKKSQALCQYILICLQNVVERQSKSVSRKTTLRWWRLKRYGWKTFTNPTLDMQTRKISMISTTEQRVL